MGVSACGSSPAQSSQASSPSNLLKASELKKYPAGSVERSFLEYWSALQFQSWGDAAAYFDPTFRDFVGTTSIIAAKKLDASVFPLTKPQIVRVKRGDTETTIYYSLRRTDGTNELASISWRRVGGNWLIVYDSRLDPELNQLARDQVELEKNGATASDPSQPPPPAAVRAGERAAQTQARFLQQELHTEKP